MAAAKQNTNRATKKPKPAKVLSGHSGSGSRGPQELAQNENPSKGSAAAGEQTLDAEALGKLFGVSGRTIRELAQKKIIPRGVGGQYPVIQSIRGYVGHLREIAAGREAGPHAAEFAEHRLREARERADRIALANAKARGELVEASEVEKAWSEVLRDVRARMLAVPSRLQHRLPYLKAKDVAEIDQTIREALERASTSEQP